MTVTRELIRQANRDAVTIIGAQIHDDEPAIEDMLGRYLRAGDMPLLTACLVVHAASLVDAFAQDRNTTGPVLWSELIKYTDQ